LKGIQLQEKKNEQSRARIDAEIAAKQDLLRRRQQDAARLADAEASAQDLVKRVQDLRHKVEMRVSTSGARIKSAPFEGAATLQSLKPSTDVKLRMATAGGSVKKSWSLCRELAYRTICPVPACLAVPRSNFGHKRAGPSPG
jgi:hypothetical protein